MKKMLIATTSLLALTAFTVAADDSDSMKPSVDPAVTTADPVSEGGAASMTSTDPSAAIPDAIPSSASHEGVRTQPDSGKDPITITTQPSDMNK